KNCIWIRKDLSCFEPRRKFIDLIFETKIFDARTLQFNFQFSPHNEGEKSELDFREEFTKTRNLEVCKYVEELKDSMNRDFDGSILNFGICKTHQEIKRLIKVKNCYLKRQSYRISLDKQNYLVILMIIL
ncbi:MAG: hypothetical protein MHMPM18_005044, partial [Marteilia pararefringens]